MFASTRREFLKVAGLGGAALALSLECRAGPTAAAPRNRPNILYIFTDQQFAEALSCLGNPDVKTPAMDSLAADGTMFTLAYCTYPLCSPSRASMLTGLMPHETGVVNNGLSIDEKLRKREIGWVFQNAGYECAYAGKGHLPQFGKMDAGHGFEILCPLGDERVANECVAFLKREHRQPFLLVASFHNPHDICEWANGKKGYPIGTPEAPSDKWPALPKNFAIPPDEPDAVRQERATWPKAIHPTVGWNEAKWRQYRFAYYRLVEKVDAEIDRLLKALREQGLEEKTVVVFSSDHGDGLAAHHWNQKWVLYEESVRVPFIVSFKGVTRPAVVDRTHLVSAGLDLFPTVCDYAGIQPPEGLRGASVRDLAEGRTPARWRDDVVVETNLGGDARMLRTARFKYMVYTRGERREQLIDLQQDPGEMVNLAADPKHASVLAEHRKRLAAWCAKVGDPFDVPK